MGYRIREHIAHGLNVGDGLVGIYQMDRGFDSVGHLAWNIPGAYHQGSEIHRRLRVANEYRMLAESTLILTNVSSRVGFCGFCRQRRSRQGPLVAHQATRSAGGCLT
ncbi:MAG: hypothetical protein DMG57_30060 [Acidobacteria bacterium]|nr:MAG: hypothetical protein DMG57_30060 [Acidobacteriota bacterium]